MYFAKCMNNPTLKSLVKDQQEFMSPWILYVEVPHAVAYDLKVCQK